MQNSTETTSTTETTSFIEHLRTATPTPPAYSKVLKPFNHAVIAQKVDCSTTYLSQLLSGYKKPSKELEHRLKALAAEIQAALNNEVCNG